MEQHRQLTQLYYGISAAGWCLISFAIIVVLIALDRLLCRRDVGHPLWRLEKSPEPEPDAIPTEAGYARSRDLEFESREMHAIAVPPRDIELEKMEEELGLQNNYGPVDNTKKHKKKKNKHGTSSVSAESARPPAA